MIQPPTTGPTVGPSTAMMPAMVPAIGWWRAGNNRKMPENTAGISVPPANPCSTRKVTSDEKLLLKAQPTDVSVKTKMPMANSQRSVNTRVNHPVSGMAVISAIRYAV